MNKLFPQLQNPGSVVRITLAAAMFYALVLAIFGCYYEIYEAFFEAFYNGTLSPGYPFRSFFFLLDIGISYLYALLYSITTAIEWRTWLMSFYLLFAAVIILKVAADILKNSLPGLLILFIQAGIFFLVIAEHIIRFNVTRVAPMLSASSLCAIIYYFPDAASISKNKRKFIALNLLFLFSALMRIEPAMIVAALGFCFALFFHSGLAQAVRLHLFPIIVIISLVAGVYIDVALSSEFYKKIEPDLEYRMSARGTVMPAGTLTHCDSIKYTAALERFWSDPHIITLDYLESLVAPSASPALIDPAQWRVAASRVLSVSKNNYAMVLLSVLLLAMALISGGCRRKVFGFAAFQFCFWAIAFFQSYSVRINDRLFGITLCVYAVFNLIAVLLIIRERPLRHVVYFLALLTAAIAVRSDNLWHVAEQYAQDRANNRANLKEIQKIAGGEILAVNASSHRSVLNANAPLAAMKISGFRKFYMNEIQAIGLIHPFRDYLESECRCDFSNFSSFYRYLRQQPHDVYFFSSESRMMLTKEYLKCFHNFDLKVEEVPDVRLRKAMDYDVGNWITLKIYRMIKQ